MGASTNAKLSPKHCTATRDERWRSNRPLSLAVLPKPGTAHLSMEHPQLFQTQHLHLSHSNQSTRIFVARSIDSRRSPRQPRSLSWYGLAPPKQLLQELLKTGAEPLQNPPIPILQHSSQRRQLIHPCDDCPPATVSALQLGACPCSASMQPSESIWRRSSGTTNLPVVVRIVGIPLRDTAPHEIVVGCR